MPIIAAELVVEKICRSYELVAGKEFRIYELFVFQAQTSVMRTELCCKICVLNHSLEGWDERNPAQQAL